MALTRLQQAEALLAEPLTLDALREYKTLSAQLDDPDLEQILDLGDAFFTAASADEGLFEIAMEQDLL